MYSRLKGQEVVWKDIDPGPPPKRVRVEYDFARKPGRRPVRVTVNVDEGEAARLVAEEGGRILS
jgi:hypothetical protein